MQLGPERRVPPATCTNCGDVTNASAAIGDSRGPEPGDYSLCVECGHLMVFTDELALRDPTDEELIAIAGDRRFVLAMTALKNVKDKIAKNPIK